jgi:hypothetical protein
MVRGMSGEPERHTQWWDALSEPPVQPRAASDQVLTASDRLSLAATIQQAQGRDPAIAALLSQWLFALKRGDPSVATVVFVLQGLDRLDRHACEPQTWQHLQVAETALAAVLARLQCG